MPITTGMGDCIQYKNIVHCSSYIKTLIVDLQDEEQLSKKNKMNNQCWGYFCKTNNDEIPTYVCLCVG